MFFSSRADGWLSLSGGRIGGVPRAEGSGPPAHPGGPQPSFSPAELQRLRAGLAEPPDADLSFIFATGEHEIAGLPAESVWAQRHGAGARVRQPDVVDTEPGQVWDKIRESYSTPAMGAGAPARHRAGLCLPGRARRLGHRRCRPPGQGPH